MILEFISITPEQVREIHDIILATEPGVIGEHPGYLEGALGRVSTAQYYENVDDIFELAAHYARAIGQGHCFADGNKRTGLVTALTFLELHQITVERNDDLEDAMVDLTTGDLPLTDFGTLLFSLADWNDIDDGSDDEDQ